MAGIDGANSLTTPRLDLGEAFMEYMWDPSIFVGPRYFAPFASLRKSGELPRVRREELLTRTGNVKRAPRTAYARGGFEVEPIAFACQERGHETPLDESEINELANDLDVEETAAEASMWQVMADLEADIASLVFDGTTTYTVANGLRTDVAASWLVAGSDIIGDVQNAIETVRARTGIRPNALLIPASFVKGLVINTGIRNAMPDSAAKTIRNVLDFLPLALGIDQVLVGGGVENTAGLGLDATANDISDIWGSTFAAVGLVAPAGSGMKTPCVGRTVFWTGDTPTESAMVEEYEEPQTRGKVIRARNFADELEMEPWFQQLLDIAG